MFDVAFLARMCKVGEYRAPLQENQSALGLSFLGNCMQTDFEDAILIARNFIFARARDDFDSKNHGNFIIVIRT